VTREYPDRPFVGVGGLVLAGERVLLVRRRYEPLAGHWSLPGGAVELGETMAAALTREIREETGLEITVGPVIEVLDRITRDGDGGVRYHFVLVDYLCWSTGGELTAASDVADAVFVHPDALEEYALSETARAVIARGLEMHRRSSRL
jgi:ADP-ribose pyrophosphatase YjhB (NUDIX family)